MKHNTVYSTGVVAYYKGSLEFSMIDNKLLLQNGAAYDEKGILLRLMKGSYVVLENTDLIFFENHKKYYFYLTTETVFKRVDAEELLTQSMPEEGIFFFITAQKHEECILLGEIEIDYDQGNEHGLRTIAIPNNAFAAGKNEIDLKNVCRHMILPSGMREAESRKISRILLDMAEVMHTKMVKESRMEFATLCSAFFQFSNRVSDRLDSPASLYEKLKKHTALFFWAETFCSSKEVSVHLSYLNALFGHEGRAFKTSFYHWGIEEEESLFYQILLTLEKISKALEKEMRMPETEEGIHETERVSDVVISEDFNLEPLVPENITVVEESAEEEESNATVLLGGDREAYIQVGRGSQSGNDIVLGKNDKTVSRIHLKITAHKQGFFLEDLSSMGTYVNGERIEKNVKKFVTNKHTVVLGKKNCVLDLTHVKIQALLNR